MTHFNTAYPKDTENLLSALTASVVTSLTLALFASAAALTISLLFKRLRPI